MPFYVCGESLLTSLLTDNANKAVRLFPATLMRVGSEGPFQVRKVGKEPEALQDPLDHPIYIRSLTLSKEVSKFAEIEIAVV